MKGKAIRSVFGRVRFYIDRKGANIGPCVLVAQGGRGGGRMGKRNRQWQKLLPKTKWGRNDRKTTEIKIN